MACRGGGTFPGMSFLLNLPFTPYFPSSPVSDEGEQGQRLIDLERQGPLPGLRHCSEAL